MTDGEDPVTPGWLVPREGDGESDGEGGGASEPEPARSRQTAIMLGVGAGILLLVGVLGAVGFNSMGFGRLGSSTPQGAARPATVEPAVAPTGTPEPTDPGLSPSAAPEPALSPSASPTPKAKPTPTPTPTPAKPSPSVPAGAQVTAASISMNPPSMTGKCGLSEVSVAVTVSITVSQPDVRLAYSVNGEQFGTILRGRTYSSTWMTKVPRRPGTSTEVLKVNLPSGASDTASFTYTCKL